MRSQREGEEIPVCIARGGRGEYTQMMLAPCPVFCVYALPVTSLTVSMLTSVSVCARACVPVRLRACVHVLGAWLAQAKLYVTLYATAEEDSYVSNYSESLS